MTQWLHAISSYTIRTNYFHKLKENIHFLMLQYVIKLDVTWVNQIFYLSELSLWHNALEMVFFPRLNK